MMGAMLVMTFPGFAAGAQFPAMREKEASYTEIEVEAVPVLIDEALKEYFTDYVTNKAYKGDDGSYKLEVSKEEIQYILYYQENGELIKVEQPEEPEKATIG